MLLLASLACVPTRLSDRVSGLLAIEASGYDGFGADLVTDSDIVTWGRMVQAGASFGEGEAPTPR